MEVLNHKVTIYIPSIDRNGKPIQHDIAVQKIAESMIEKYNGVTATKSQGMWTNLDGEVITENVTLLTSYTNNVNYHKLQNAIELWKELLDQESFAYTIDGEMFIL